MVSKAMHHASLKTSQAMPAKNRIDLAGRKLGRWTVIKVAQNGSRNSRIRWLCQCKCGTRKNIPSNSLIHGRSESCGCLMRELVGKRAFKHGHNKHNESRTPIYRTWASMLSRCNNPKNLDYKFYGGRDIVVCKRWFNFADFLADMGNKPVGTEIDRINNNLGYFKNNCRWVTHKTNCRNTQRNRLVEFKRQSKSLAEWGEITGLGDTIRQRLDSGWTVENAITLPKNSTRSKSATIGNKWIKEKPMY